MSAERIWQYVRSDLSYISIHLPTYCHKVNRDRAALNQILSKTAKETIAQGKYNERSKDAREPPYMRPSTDPEDYSQVQCVVAALRCLNLIIHVSVVFRVQRLWWHHGAVRWLQSGRLLWHS